MLSEAQGREILEDGSCPPRGPWRLGSSVCDVGRVKIRSVVMTVAKPRGLIGNFASQLQLIVVMWHTCQVLPDFFFLKRS